jgi:hypothetical protein
MAETHKTENNVPIVANMEFKHGENVIYKANGHKHNICIGEWSLQFTCMCY